MGDDINCNGTSTLHENDCRAHEVIGKQKSGLKWRGHLPLRKQKSEDIVMKQMSLDKIREKLQDAQTTIIQKLDEQLSGMVEELLCEVEKAELPKEYQLLDDDRKYADKKKPEKEGYLPDKQFLSRNSLLTDLFEIKHIRTIYHIFIAILLLLFLNTVIFDFVDTGKFNLDFDIIRWNFSGYKTVLVMWIGMMMSTLFVYSCFIFWANYRILLNPKSMALKLWDYLWLVVLVLYQIVFICVPADKLMAHKMAPASSVIVLMEQLRMMMKSHAFIRSNVPRVLRHKLHQSGDKEYIMYPGFSQYLYFLFAPTLVYRDSYPRTKEVRWKVVAWNLLEVIGVIFYTHFIFVRFLVPVFRQFGQKPMTPKVLVLSVFGCMLPGALAMLCGFYCLLHSWMNAFAEMLQFADRLFYKDWWNSSTFSNYYRTWNVVVHDWLYTYVYKDVCEHVLPNSRVVAQLITFTISAIFHEYVLTFTFHFFYPVLLLEFMGAGVGVMFIANKKGVGGNVLMWLSLCIGTGLLMSLYSMEFYARINCPPSYESILDFFVPRSWTCNAIQAEGVHE